MAAKPDYIVKVLEKNSGRTGIVGAAWVKKGEQICIVLNPCVVLQYRDDMVISLFPNEQKQAIEDRGEAM